MTETARSTRRRSAVALLLLIAPALLVLTPFAWLVAAAFKSKDAFAQWLFFPPVNEWTSGALTLENFRELFRPQPSPQGPVTFGRYVFNSLFLASTTTVSQLLTSSMAGYALAVHDFRGRRTIIGFMLASLIVPGMLLVAPVYQLSVTLGLVDTYAALLIPGCVSTWGVFLFRQAIRSVPMEIVEAARVDGCREVGIYWTVVMPLLRPIAAAFCLVAFLGSWNAYLGPNVMLHGQHRLPVAVALSYYMAEHSSQYGVFLAGTLLALIPPAIVFLALQREMIAGLTSGAVKG